MEPRQLIPSWQVKKDTNYGRILHLLFRIVNSSCAALALTVRREEQIISTDSTDQLTVPDSEETMFRKVLMVLDAGVLGGAT